MRLPHLAVPLAFACGVCSHAAPFDEHVGALFRPLLGGSIALSPAGQRIAYTSQSGGELELLVINLERPGPPRKLRVESAADADPSAPPLRFLRWATEDRLIFAPAERIVPLPAITDRRGRSTPNPDGPAILAPICFVDADVRQEGTLIDARHFMETPANSVRTLADLLRTPMELAASRTRDEPVRWRMPHLDIIGFDPGDRERLVIRTRGAYSPPMQHAVDIRTGHVSQFGGELPLPAGEVQVFDSYRLTVVGERREAQRPATVWHDDELQRVQQELEAKFPQRLVEILDWSESRSRVLFRVSGGRDPGRVFLFQREEDLALEVLRLAPWLNPARLHDTRFFEFNGPDGASLSGYLTWPGRPVRTPPPLLVVFPSGFPGQAQAAFDPEAQALAELGFAVARLNHRWVGSIPGDDPGSRRGAPDRVSIEDAGAAVAWLAARHAKRPFDATRVATLGRGFGGFLAVRALQLQPAVFRCGIAIDEPNELPPGLFEPARADGSQLPVVNQVAGLQHPVLLLAPPGRHPSPDISTTALHAKLEALGRLAEHFELDPGFAAGRPSARAAAYRRIESFLHQHLEKTDEPPRRGGTVE